MNKRMRTCLVVLGLLALTGGPLWGQCGCTDTRAPTVVSFTPAGGMYSWNATVNITVRVEDDCGLYKVELRKETALVKTWYVSGTGPVDCSPPYQWTPTQGTTTFTAIVTDMAQRTGQGSVTYSIDNTGPTVDITKPTITALALADVVTVAATAQDSGSGVAQVVFSYGGTAYGDIATVRFPTGNPPEYTCTWNTTGLPEGNYTILAVATDGAGNSGSDTLPVTLTLYPQVSIAKPAVENEFVGGTTFVKAYASHPSGIQWVKFWVDSQLKGSMTSVSDYWRYDWDTSGTQAGNHTIGVQAHANSGSQWTATRTVYAQPLLKVEKINFDGGHDLYDRSIGTVGQSIEPPQWWLLQDGQPATQPVAYTIGSQMTINVGMSMVRPGPDVGYIYAKYDVVDAWSDGTQLPSVSQQAYLYFQSPDEVWLAHSPTARPKVMDYTFTEHYNLYARRSQASDWAPAGTADVEQPEMYLTFGPPVTPWGVGGYTCWSRVLKDACEWMPDTGYSSTQQLDAEKRLAYTAYWWTDAVYDGGYTHYDAPTFRLWDFIRRLQPPTADCRDMSIWWQVLCNSLGLNVSVKRIDGPFWYKSILPTEWTVWTAGQWSFHQVGWASNVFDPCAELSHLQDQNHTDARVPQNENIDNPYKLDLSSDPWTPQTPFAVTEVN